MQVTIRIKYNGTLRNGIGRSEASRMGGEWNGMEWDRNVLLFGFSVVAFDDSTTVKLWSCPALVNQLFVLFQQLLCDRPYTIQSYLPRLNLPYSFALSAQSLVIAFIPPTQTTNFFPSVPFTFLYLMFNLYFFNHLTSSPAPSPRRFFKDCSIVYVIVDDKIPVKAKDGRPIFGHAKDPNELWVCILEKGDSASGKHGAIKLLNPQSKPNAHVSLFKLSLSIK